MKSFGRIGEIFATGSDAVPHRVHRIVLGSEELWRRRVDLPSGFVWTRVDETHYSTVITKSITFSGTVYSHNITRTLDVVTGTSTYSSGEFSSIPDEYANYGGIIDSKIAASYQLGPYEFGNAIDAAKDNYNLDADAYSYENFAIDYSYGYTIKISGDDIFLLNEATGDIVGIFTRNDVVSVRYSVPEGIEWVSPSEFYANSGYFFSASPGETGTPNSYLIGKFDPNKRFYYIFNEFLGKVYRPYLTSFSTDTQQISARMCKFVPCAYGLWMLKYYLNFTPTDTYSDHPIYAETPSIISTAGGGNNSDYMDEKMDNTSDGMYSYSLEGEDYMIPLGLVITFNAYTGEVTVTHSLSSALTWNASPFTSLPSSSGVKYAFVNSYNSIAGTPAVMSVALASTGQWGYYSFPPLHNNGATKFAIVAKSSTSVKDSTYTQAKGYFRCSKTISSTTRYFYFNPLTGQCACDFGTSGTYRTFTLIPTRTAYSKVSKCYAYKNYNYELGTQPSPLPFSGANDYLIGDIVNENDSELDPLERYFESDDYTVSVSTRRAHFYSTKASSGNYAGVSIHVEVDGGTFVAIASSDIIYGFVSTNSFKCELPGSESPDGFKKYVIVDFTNLLAFDTWFPTSTGGRTGYGSWTFDPESMSWKAASISNPDHEWLSLDFDGEIIVRVG